MVNIAIRLISDYLEHESSPVVILAARYLITEVDRDKLPDWIEALANANIDNWDEALDEVRILKRIEDVCNSLR